MFSLPRISSTFAAGVVLCCAAVTQAQFDSSQLAAIEVDAYRPSPVPDRIILNLSGDPATERAVNWRTDNDLAIARAQITYADGGPYQADRAVTLEGRTKVLEFDAYTSYHHRVRFKDLRPDTKYVYRVGDGQVWSEWMHFTTASDASSPFSFIYFGDAQNDVKSRWSRVVREAYSGLPKADFILHAGDLVNDPNSDQEWGQWFYAAGWINGTIPSIATPGNHEYEAGKLSMQWRPHFTLPKNGPDNDRLQETVYFIDYQGTRFISLDTPAMDADPLVATLQQKYWLEALLKNNPNRWTIIFHHHPMNAATQGRTGHAMLNLHFKTLYEKYDVDLVLQGHDHAYARGENLSTGGYWYDRQSPVYVVSVSGPKMYDGGAEWAEVTARDTQLYQLISVSEERIDYEAYRADGEIYDALTITKDHNGVRTVY